MNTATRTAIEVLAPVVRQTIDKHLAAAPVDMMDASDIKAEVTREVAAVVVNQTNQEPWYQSRVTWGAIFAVGGGIAGIAGYSLTPEDQLTLVNQTVEVVKATGAIVAAVGGALAWYGRWRAKKPLGA
ncbi:MAG: hypothetical protein DI629_12020 [Mesorhizobium amorphae]|nr:MAG: hypothetical protein DI629_12020 [Mesorhizobium amorphae]